MQSIRKLTVSSQAPCAFWAKIWWRSITRNASGAKELRESIIIKLPDFLLIVCRKKVQISDMWRRGGSDLERIDPVQFNLCPCKISTRIRTGSGHAKNLIDYSLRIVSKHFVKIHLLLCNFLKSANIGLLIDKIRTLSEACGNLVTTYLRKICNVTTCILQDSAEVTYHR